MNPPRLELGASAILAVLGVAVAGLVVWRAYRAAGDLAQAGADLVRNDLNPASSNNVINRGLELLGQAATGDESWTLGGQVFDWTHTDQADPSRNTAIAAVNPADQDNLVNRALSSFGRAVSGDSRWTLGGWIYDVTHPGQP